MVGWVLGCFSFRALALCNDSAQLAQAGISNGGQCSTKIQIF
jgi:hypothetical protein